MLRWRWVLVMWLIGISMTAYGVYIELNVRDAVGGGAKSFLANVFYGKTIAHYRWISQTCVFLGPAVILFGFLLRRNWEPEREAAWLAQQAEKRRDRAARLHERAKSLTTTDPDRAERLRQRAEKLTRTAQRLSTKADRRSGDLSASS